MHFPLSKPPSSRTALSSALKATATLAVAWTALQTFRLLYARYRRIDTAPFSNTEDNGFNQRSVSDSLRRFLIVGDSTGVGTGSIDSRSTVAGRLASAFPGTVIVNHAQDRARSFDIAAQIESSSGRFDLILAFVGSNDALRFSSYQTVLQAAERALDAASSRADHVAVVPPADLGAAPIWVWPLDVVFSRRAETVRRAWQYAMRERTNVHLVDLLMRRDRDPFRLAPRRYYSPDGIHPSADGYALWFAQITRQVPVFAEAESSVSGINA